ncbi:hypothetical protein [Lutibacter citreus]|uniref:hypothetical protein n=1 Tax=Lutibacter citreus TaxID=2138210 RepID=UPI000DBE6999|nr:hypothetical protein [Lutibacter citreus]
MKYFLQIILLSIILANYSCTEKKIESKVEHRIVSIYMYDSIPEKMEYQLVIKSNDTLIDFYYWNLNNPKGSMFFNYLTKTKTLIWEGDKYIIDKENTFSDLKFSEYKFDNFQQEDREIDGTGPILFNQEFGILGIGNVFGPELIFYPNLEISDVDKDILKILHD